MGLNKVRVGYVNTCAIYSLGRASQIEGIVSTKNLRLQFGKTWQGKEPGAPRSR